MYATEQIMALQPFGRVTIQIKQGWIDRLNAEVGFVRAGDLLFLFYLPFNLALWRDGSNSPSIDFLGVVAGDYGGHPINHFDHQIL
jgi:hypothetical protein